MRFFASLYCNTTQPTARPMPKDAPEPGCPGGPHGAGAFRNSVAAMADATPFLARRSCERGAMRVQRSSLHHGLLTMDLRLRWLAAAFSLSCGRQMTGQTCEEQMSSAKGSMAEALLGASSGCVTDDDCELISYELPSHGMTCIVGTCWPSRAVTKVGLGKLEAAVQACRDNCGNCPCVEVNPQCAAIEHTVFTPACNVGQCAVVATCDPAHCPALSQGAKCCVFSAGQELCGADYGPGCVVTP